MNDLKTLAKDAVEISAKTALSCIPVGGALATNVWDAVKSNSARKRLEEWQDMLEDRLSRIEATLEDIGNNENFTSAIYQATEQAIRTGSRTKSLKILVFFQNPPKFSDRNPSMFMGSPGQVLFDCYPELKAQEELVSKIVKELHADGVFSLDSLNTVMTGNGALAKRTTKLGDEFIDFITRY